MKRSLTLRSLVAAFSSAFCIGVAGAPPLPPKNGEETLWKTESFDAVVSLRACPDSGACGYIYWVNPADKKIYDYFGQRKPSGEEPTEQDVSALCGFAPRTKFSPPTDEKWEGRMEMRGMGMDVNVKAEPLDENRLRVVFSKGFIRQTETWTKVSPDDKRYPRCDVKKVQP